MKICTEIIVPVTLEIEEGNAEAIKKKAALHARVALQDALIGRCPFTKAYGDGSRIKFRFEKPITKPEVTYE